MSNDFMDGYKAAAKQMNYTDCESASRTTEERQLFWAGYEAYWDDQIDLARIMQRDMRKLRGLC